MGVYIKGMEMPKDCLHCPMCDNNDDCVMQEEKNFQTWKEQKAGCPLVELPENHGRLIDADALTDFLKCLLPERGMWKIDGDVGKNAVCETVAEAIEMVKNMETVMPETNSSEFPNSSTLQPTCNQLATDCISRQAAIDAIAERMEMVTDPYGYGEKFWEGLCIAKSIVADISSAQPERKMGHWIRAAGMNECCSACNKYFPLSSFTGRPFDINYCPNCGADMRGEQNV